MKFSEERSNGQEYERKESLGNSKEADGRKYISRGFLPLIGKHMYHLAHLYVNSNIIRKYGHRQHPLLPVVFLLLFVFLFFRKGSPASHDKVFLKDLQAIAN